MSCSAVPVNKKKKKHIHSFIAGFVSKQQGVHELIKNEKLLNDTNVKLNLKS